MLFMDWTLWVGKVALIACVATSANAAPHRSKAVLRAFVSQQACPSTGLHRLPCPGWQMDHIVPLCAGGPDGVENLQWLTREEHKEKTRGDVRYCRSAK